MTRTVRVTRPTGIKITMGTDDAPLGTGTPDVTTSFIARRDRFGMPLRVVTNPRTGEQRVTSDMTDFAAPDDDGRIMARPVNPTATAADTIDRIDGVFMTGRVAATMATYVPDVNRPGKFIADVTVSGKRATGIASRRRVVRTVDMGDAPLPSVPTRPAKRPVAAATPKRASVDTARPVRTPNADVDRVIRSTGYTGPIDGTMRKLARDVMAHRASVAAYTGGN